MNKYQIVSGSSKLRVRKSISMKQIAHRECSISSGKVRKNPNAISKGMDPVRTRVERISRKNMKESYRKNLVSHIYGFERKKNTRVECLKTNLGQVDRLDYTDVNDNKL